MNDDRQEFLQERSKLIDTMAADPAVSAANLELLTTSDRHGYSYMWDWLGVPIIQMPADIVAMQEIVWRTRPDVIVETGVARGGSAILHSSLLRLLGNDGFVVAVDIDIRPHNREAIESHPLGGNVRLLEGSSVDEDLLSEIQAMLPTDARVMVVLDSDHTHTHVLQELNAYRRFVTAGMYMVVADTFVEELPQQLHRPRGWGLGNNPSTAVDEFLEKTNEFRLDTSVAKKMLMSSSAAGYLLRA